ncbi:MAG: hypothetical protein AAGU19_08745 [Prolixibacteraceae bacterium]
MTGKFFHIPKARKFQIPYRFYDPDKEAMQEREERIKKELGIDEKKPTDPNYRPNIRGQFRRSLKSTNSRDAQKSSATRLILLIVILGLVFYLLLKF